jgi:hypothetical protein
MGQKHTKYNNPVSTIDNTEETNVNSVRQVQFNQEELNMIRSDWKEITKNGDYKDYGLNMMIK